ALDAPQLRLSPRDSLVQVSNPAGRRAARIDGHGEATDFGVVTTELPLELLPLRGQFGQVGIYRRTSLLQDFVPQSLIVCDTANVVDDRCLDLCRGQRRGR